VRDFVEAYAVAARAVAELQAPLAQRELVKRIHELGERLYLTGQLRRRESGIDATYQNAIASFRERGVLTDDKDKKLKRTSASEAQRLHAEIAALLPTD
jgi:glycerol-3-phosphate O-acyltransferase